jgi:hypothetical protein
MSTNKSPIEGAMIGLITVIITQIVLKSIGINKISVILVSTLLIASGVIFAVTMIKNGNKGLGFRLNITASIIMLLACILGGAMFIMIECYPQFGDTHKILAMILVFSALGSFLLVVIFWTVTFFIITKNK